MSSSISLWTRYDVFKLNGECSAQNSIPCLRVSERVNRFKHLLVTNHQSLSVFLCVSRQQIFQIFQIFKIFQIFQIFQIPSTEKQLSKVSSRIFFFFLGD